MANTGNGFHHYRLCLYGKQRLLRVKQVTALWEPAGQMVQVLILSYQKGKEPTYFFSTHGSLSVANMLVRVAGCWSLETLFPDGKRHLRLEQWQCPVQIAVTPSVALTCVATTLLIDSLQVPRGPAGAAGVLGSGSLVSQQDNTQYGRHDLSTPLPHTEGNNFQHIIGDLGKCRKIRTRLAAAAPCGLSRGSNKDCQKQQNQPKTAFSPPAASSTRQDKADIYPDPICHAMSAKLQIDTSSERHR
ncbi:MAG: hypothetical protein ACUVTG_12100 [Candidatus Oleimicrobiaceae bacterium]